MTSKEEMKSVVNGKREIVAILTLLTAGLLQGHAAIYYVAPDGSDTNTGTSDSPWRTVEKAASVVQAGDVVRVRAGTYEERVSTKRGGAGENARIRFEGESGAVMQGWVINHPYVSVSGFTFRGQSAQSVLDAYVRINRDGDGTEVLDCHFGPGIRCVSTGAVFSASAGSIVVPEGALLERGFRAGMYVAIERATYPASLVNARQMQVLDVRDSTLIVSGPLQDEGPVPVYISGSAVYALYVASGAENCRILNNVFEDLAYDAMLIGGQDCVVQGNVIRGTHGWDAIHYGGTNNVFRLNVIESGPFEVYQVSPDAFENYTPIPYENILISNNMVLGFLGVLGSQKGAGTMRGLAMVGNVFVDAGWLSITHPDTLIEKNTFLRVARTNNPVMARSSHAVVLEADRGATNCSIRNNIFIDCGQPLRPSEESQVGWYEVKGPGETLIIRGNVVAGAPPGYEGKVGWEEDPRRNGGDPHFVNIEDPLGPDGLPFTEDDGLRLSEDSPLTGIGDGGATPGAYEASIVAPVELAIVRVDGEARIRLMWPEGDGGWLLETATELRGPWSIMTNEAAVLDGLRILEITPEGAWRFFRLRR